MKPTPPKIKKPPKPKVQAAPMGTRKAAPAAPVKVAPVMTNAFSTKLKTIVGAPAKKKK